MNESAQPLTRRAIAVLTDPRTIRVSASAFYPALMSAIAGVSGTILNVGLTALALWPVRHAHPPIYLVSTALVFMVGLPVLYFILGGRYGFARAAFTVYEATRPAVPALPDGEIRARRVPRPIRWLFKAILTIAGAGDRLTDAVAEIDEREPTGKEIVGAIVDDLVAEHLVAPPGRRSSSWRSSTRRCWSRCSSRREEVGV